MTCERFFEQLDSYLDDELPTEVASELESHASECTHCAAEMQLAARLLAELRDQPAAICPDDVYRRALASIERADRPATHSRHTRRVPRIAAFGAFAALVMAGMVTLLIVPRAEPDRYTEAEVAEARQQVELAFGLVGRAGHSAGLYLREDVFSQHVLGPIGRSLTPHNE